MRAAMVVLFEDVFVYFLVVARVLAQVLQERNSFAQIDQFDYVFFEGRLDF